MDKIDIKQLMDSASYPDAGYMLYLKARPIIEADGIVRMDLTDVASLPTLFMNMSFGKLINDFGKARVMQALKFYSITKVQLERIKKYFERFDTTYVQ
ncbi:MAG: STAS-like domain-containing protein [Pseudoflavonifractor sp.]|nr:STAS-like domain-containing protein [Pseudoflavonifractor sp.]